MTQRTLSDGEALFRIQEASNELYQVVSGKIKCNIYSQDGTEVVIGTLLSGETFGEQGLIDELPRATNTYSVGDSVVNVLSKRHFFRLNHKHPEINTQLLIMFSHRMRVAFEVNTDNLTLPLHQRLARCIYRIVLNQSSKMAQNNELEITISHADLARMVGVSRQSVSKELKQMEREKLICIQYGKIVINNMDALSKAYHDAN
ncbi:Crp/Fnr family transcriptional regulator [Psychrobacter fozii]|uniref:CRP-like cAMP-binding protein n=1 Tax=Psychrobacter fozii TaxID=198480 RepID=A0A2V4UV00_9GAMM|nr:Crp/Fnr family transcriptional regulator [Psychrobacter fozii]PYE36610.1 CRP-like cAMP-binding protein [Psychrobacter fozii]